MTTKSTTTATTSNNNNTRLPTLCDLATNLAIQGRLQESTRLYQKILDIEPTFEQALFNISLNYEEEGEKNLAITYLQKLVEIYPNHVKGLGNLANLLDDIGDEAGALQRYRQALQISTSSNVTDIDLFNINLNLAIISLRAGDLIQAREAAQRAVAIQRDHPGALVTMGEITWRCGGSTQEALTYAVQGIIQANKIKNMSLVVNGCMIAATCWEESNPRKSLEYLLKAIEVDPLHIIALIRAYFISLGIVVGSDINHHVAAAAAADPVIETKQNSIIQMIKDWCVRNHDEYGLKCIPYIFQTTNNTHTDFLNNNNDFQTSIMNNHTISPLCEALILHSRTPFSNMLTNKCLLYKVLIENKYENICPQSWIVTDSESAKRIVKAQNDIIQDKNLVLYFLKQPIVQRAQGIVIVKEPPQIPPFADEERLLQHGIPPALLDGRKFGCRIMAALIMWPMREEISVFVFQEGICTICFDAWSGDSTSLTTHVASTSVQRSLPNFDRKKQKGIASHLLSPKKFQECLPHIENKILLACQAAVLSFQKSTNNNNNSNLAGPRRTSLSFQVFGFDVIFSPNYDVYLAEANSSPQFQDTKKDDVMKETIAIPMINGLGYLLSLGFDRRRKDQNSSITLSSSSSDELRIAKWKFVGDII
jgi:tetratricopeptide (TPR) repeat protein